MTDLRLPPAAARLPWGVIGALALGWLVESAVARHPDAVLPMLAWCWRDAWTAAGREAVGCDVLCFGDSQVKLGVLPIVLQDRAGRRAYNLAVHRGLPATSVRLLRRALEAGARPRAAVVDFFPGLLTTRPRFDAELWPEVAGPADLAALAWQARDPWLVLRAGFSRLAPSYTLRDEVRAAVVGGLTGRSPEKVRLARGYRDNWSAHRGAQVEEGQGHPDDPNSNPGTRSAWKCRPENERAVVEFLDLARAHGVTVYWLLAPLRPKEEGAERRAATDRAYEQFVRKLTAGRTGVVVVDARASAFAPDEFLDPVHLNRRGAERLTAVLAGAVGGDDPGVAVGWRTLEVGRARR